MWKPGVRASDCTGYRISDYRVQNHHGLIDIFFWRFRAKSYLKLLDPTLKLIGTKLRCLKVSVLKKNLLFPAVPDRSLQQAVGMAIERPCTLCPKTFPAPSKLRVHMRVHTGEKPHICKVCGKSFKEAGHLKTHRRIHSGGKTHGCEICGKSFSEAGSLKKHLRIHRGEKPYKCTYCVYSCSDGNYIKTHIRTHTGEKPFKCTYCVESFVQASHVKSHEMIHTISVKHKTLQMLAVQPYIHKS